MRQVCRLCKAPAEDGSLFCSAHRAAAARFAAAFAPGAVPVSPAPTAQTPASAAPTPQTPASAADADTPLATAPRNEEEIELAEALLPIWTEVRARAAKNDPQDAGRRPLLSVYIVAQRLHVRAFWAIVPAAVGDARPLPPTSELLAEAMAPNGAVFAAVAEHYAALAPELRRGAVQSLDVQIVTYAGVVAINATRPEGKVDRRAALVLRDGSFVATSPDAVRDLLSRERW
jgi:hypothetical protein